MENKKMFLEVLVICSFVLNIFFLFLFFSKEQQYKLEKNIIYNILLNNCENEVYNTFSNYRSKDLQKIFETANQKTLNQLKSLRIEIKSQEQNLTDSIIFFNPLGAKKIFVTSWMGYRKKISKNIGGNSLRKHEGIDLVGSKKIFATFAGRVSFVGKKGDYGNLIIIQHRDKLESRYAHLSKIFVKKGDFVFATELIGLMGQTGRTTGEHLHFEIRKNNKLIDLNRIYFKNI